MKSSKFYFIVILLFGFTSLLIGSDKNSKIFNPQIKSVEQLHNEQLALSILDFDGDYRPILEVRQTWSLAHYRWENQYMWENVYPISKVSSTNSTLFRRRTTFGWENENWVNKGWWELYTNDDGFIEQEISYTNFGTPMQEINYYGPYTNGQAAYFESLIDNGSGLENDQRITYTYNADGDITEMISEDGDGNNWVFSWRGTATYSDPGCQTTWTNYIYDNGNWIADRRSTNIYDRADCMTEMVMFQPWPLRDCNPTQVTNEISADNGATWTPSTIETFSDFGGDCLPRTSINDLNGYQERELFEFNPIPGAKLSSTYDNSNLRCTKKTTQYFKDNDWVNSEKYWYSYEGLILDTDSDESVPDEFALEQNYPNPFNPETTIEFNLEKESLVTLSVYDVTGKLINELTNKEYNIGNHSVIWDGLDKNGVKVSSGLYFYTLIVNDVVQTKKMVLVN